MSRHEAAGGFGPGMGTSVWGHRGSTVVRVGTEEEEEEEVSYVCVCRDPELAGISHVIIDEVV